MGGGGNPPPPPPEEEEEIFLLPLLLSKKSLGDVTSRDPSTSSIFAVSARMEASSSHAPRFVGVGVCACVDPRRQCLPEVYEVG